MKTGEKRQRLRYSMVAALSTLMCLSTTQIAEAETYKVANWNQVQSSVNGAENDDVIDLSDLLTALQESEDKFIPSKSLKENRSP